MSEFYLNDYLDDRSDRQDGSIDSLAPDDDLLMEQILENMNTTPLGKVLKRIALLPEVRQKKVLTVRQQLTSGKYDLTQRLNVALDKVLEDLIA